MADLAYLNSEAFGWRLAELFEPEFLDGLGKILDVARARGGVPTPAETLAILGCTRQEFECFLAIVAAGTGVAGRPVDVEVFGFEVTIAAVLHPDPASGTSAWSFTHWPDHGRRRSS